MARATEGAVMVTVCGPPKTVLMMSFYGNLDAGEPVFKATGRVNVERGGNQKQECGTRGISPRLLCQGQPGTHCLMRSGFLLQMAEGDQ